jgi:aminopeptidase N
VQLNVINNPYNASQNILLTHVRDGSEALAIQKKLGHYGKYSDLIFNHGKVSHKHIEQAKNGISVLSHQAPKAVQPSALPTFGQIVPELLQSKIIYIGEQHDQFAHHINQLLIIKKLNERGIQLAVGMEMFKKSCQQVIDDYLANRIDERQFLKASQYFSEWGYNYHLYKPIIDYLKTHDIPLIALNLEGSITSRVARDGMEGLGEDEKKYLPESLDFTDKHYRDDLKQVYTLHDSQDELNDFNYFLQAQVLWDESMAETAHAFLKTAPHRTLIVLAGNGHFKHKYGIPKRLYRRNREAFVVVLQDEALEDDIADYVLINEKLKAKEAPKLGVTVKEKEDGLMIKSILNKSPAENAKLKKGDVIQQFDAHPIASLSDLRLALFYTEFGKAYPMEIKREDDKIKLNIKLFDMHASPERP